MKENMKRLMREAGLEYGERSHTFNSRLAQELGKWADTQNEKSEIHDLIYRAYFVEGKNISDMNELLKIAETAGFDRTSAKEILEKRSFKLIVDEDWKKAGNLASQVFRLFSINNTCWLAVSPMKYLSILFTLQPNNDEFN